MNKKAKNASVVSEVEEKEIQVTKYRKSSRLGKRKRTGS